MKGFSMNPIQGALLLLFCFVLFLLFFFSVDDNFLSLPLFNDFSDLLCMSVDEDTPFLASAELSLAAMDEDDFLFSRSPELSAAGAHFFPEDDGKTAEKGKKQKGRFNKEDDAVILECAKANWLARQNHLNAKNGKLQVKKLHSSFVGGMREKTNDESFDVPFNSFSNHFKKVFQDRHGYRNAEWEGWKRQVSAVAIVKARKEGLKAAEIREPRFRSAAEMIELFKERDKDGGMYLSVRDADDVAQALWSFVRNENAYTDLEFPGRAYWVVVDDDDTSCLKPGDMCALLLSDKHGVAVSSSVTSGDQVLCFAVVGDASNDSLEQGDLRRSREITSPSALIVFAGVIPVGADAGTRGELMCKDNRPVGLFLGNGAVFVWMSAEDGNLFRVDLVELF
jgi:hypothetical protein